MNACCERRCRYERRRLRDILEAIAERYLDRDKAIFEREELLQTWFMRHLQIVGEAARALPEDVRALAPDIPWPKIIGMRNVLVHDYFEIDTDTVWDAASRDVPALKPALERLLRTLEGQSR
ncbi:MAG: DUF86 domain-containing protein [Actinobacteria bacterium]|nr:DUF86 domain-containing protein [Actinomycetota bacterium]MCL5942340.1 DUF86 domain-containing protein [Actinomycetota bacterium]